VNYIEEYGRAILDGTIIAPHRIKQIYKMLLDKIENPKGDWIFDLEKANRPIEFIENFCKQSQGEMGKPLKLMLFQKAKLQAVFGFVHKETGFRQYTEVLDIRGSNFTLWLGC
jgi:phage terminase large subunit-like protein